MRRVASASSLKDTTMNSFQALALDLEPIDCFLLKTLIVFVPRAPRKTAMVF